MSWLIHLEKKSWQIVPIDENPTVFPDENLAGQASPIAEALEQLDYQGEPAILGLAADWCLAATVPVPSPQMLRRREAMRYHLEDAIPWTAEEFVVDYVGHASKVFMVAIRIDPLQELLRELEELDVHVVVVCPTALLAAIDHSTIAETPVDQCLLLQHQGHVDVLVMEERQIVRWSHCRAELPPVLREIKSASLAGKNNKPVVGLGLDSSLAAKLVDLGIPIITESCPLLSAAGKNLSRILEGQIDPPLNLRRDELAGRMRVQRLSNEMNRLRLAMALSILLLTIGFWIRGNAYRAATETAEQQLTEVHEALFPDHEVPAEVVSAIETEYRKLQGTRGVDQSVPSRPNADLILQRLLTALPKKLRFRLPEIHVEGSKVSLGGEVRTNSDADLIAAALRKQGFSVDAPKIQRLSEKGFSVRLIAIVEKP